MMSNIEQREESLRDPELSARLQALYSASEPATMVRVRFDHLRQRRRRARVLTGVAGAAAVLLGAAAIGSVNTGRNFEQLTVQDGEALREGLVKATVTGVVQPNQVLCPTFDRTNCPAPVRLHASAGQPPLTPGATVALSGSYDGESLTNFQVLNRDLADLIPLMKTPCSALSNPPQTDQSRVRNLLSDAYGGSSETDSRLASTWYDPQANVWTFLFKGAAPELPESILREFGSTVVCLAGGAPYSMTDLEGVQLMVDRALRDRPAVGNYAVSGWTDGRAKAVVELENLDQPLRRELEALSPAVSVFAFVELGSGTLLDRMPIPRQGDVLVDTSAVRYPPVYRAAASFQIVLDEQQNCVYGNTSDGQRVRLVWPYGYTASRTATGVLVRDALDQVVAGEGDSVTLGGGFSPKESVTGLCGGAADLVWLVGR